MLTGQEMSITVSPVLLTIGAMISTAAVGWGFVQATIKQVSREIQSVRHDLKNFQQAQMGMIVETHERIARIEGKLGV